MKKIVLFLFVLFGCEEKVIQCPSHETYLECACDNMCWQSRRLYVLKHHRGENSWTCICKNDLSFEIQLKESHRCSNNDKKDDRDTCKNCDE